MGKEFRERRRSPRVRVRLRGDRLSGERHRGLFVENVSESGIYMVTEPGHPLKNIGPGDYLAVKLQLPTEELVTLHCKVTWFRERPPEEGSGQEFGLEVIKPPEEYLNFVKRLFEEHS